MPKGIEFVKVEETKKDLRKEEPPLVDVKVSNPLTYIKSWWRKIIGNEGVEFRIKVKPLTAIAISLILITFGFGIGRIVLPFKIPFFEYSSKYEPTPVPDITRQTAFTGILQKGASEKYYLVTESAEAVNLEVPIKVDLVRLVGKRIFATGRYNPETRTLMVLDVKDLEILSLSPSPIPTNTATPTATSTLSPTTSPTASASATPSEGY